MKKHSHPAATAWPSDGQAELCASLHQRKWKTLLAKVSCFWPRTRREVPEEYRKAYKDIDEVMQNSSIL